MGKGKGEPEYWAAVVRPGMVLYEIGGVSEEAARLCFARLAHKMPVHTQLSQEKTAVDAPRPTPGTISGPARNRVINPTADWR
jgi:large subunit ribosomal protein L16